MPFDPFAAVGTNDTPASGWWSPTNNTSPSNTVDVTDSVYDNGGVGDALCTGSTLDSELCHCLYGDASKFRLRDTRAARGEWAAAARCPGCGGIGDVLRRVTTVDRTRAESTRLGAGRQPPR